MSLRAKPLSGMRDWQPSFGWVGIELVWTLTRSRQNTRSNKCCQRADEVMCVISRLCDVCGFLTEMYIESSCTHLAQLLAQAGPATAPL